MYVEQLTGSFTQSQLTMTLYLLQTPTAADTFFYEMIDIK